ncbi:MAG: type II toxin-antitoxin system VapC family toxin [Thermoplasmata archaeon]
MVGKWFLEEEFPEEARQLRDDFAADMVEVDAPCLLPFEVLNAVRFANVFTPKDLGQIAETLDRFSLSLHPLEGTLSSSTVELATSEGLSVSSLAFTHTPVRALIIFYP